MIAEVKLAIGDVTYRVRLPIRPREVGELRKEFMDKLGSAFDKSIADLKTKWKRRNKGAEGRVQNHE